MEEKEIKEIITKLEVIYYDLENSNSNFEATMSVYNAIDKLRKELNNRSQGGTMKVSL